MNKSTVEEIRERFDQDVERFSNLETGQSATIDAALAMDLVAETAASTNSNAKAILDIGCGAGNYTLKFLQKLGRSDVETTLIDLSMPMLERAQQRVAATGCKNIKTMQIDIREIPLPTSHYDVILAAAVLHHLRAEEEWQAAFKNIFQSLNPGGSFWIFDLVAHHAPAVEQVMNKKYAEYLTNFKGAAYKEEVFAYIEREDTPRPLGFQLDLLKSTGFKNIEVLHKNACFAAFGAQK